VSQFFSKPLQRVNRNCSHSERVRQYRQK